MTEDELDELVGKLSREAIDPRLGKLVIDAAYNITKLRQRINVLEDALGPFARRAKSLDEAVVAFNKKPLPDDRRPITHFSYGELRAARAALGGDDE